MLVTSDAGGPDFNGRAFLQLSTGYDASAELQLVPPEGAFKAGSVQVRGKAQCSAGEGKHTM